MSFGLCLTILVGCNRSLLVIYVLCNHNLFLFFHCGRRFGWVKQQLSLYTHGSFCLNLISIWKIKSLRLCFTVNQKTCLVYVWVWDQNFLALTIDQEWSSRLSSSVGLIFTGLCHSSRWWFNLPHSQWLQIALFYKVLDEYSSELWLVSLSETNSI